MRWPMSLGAGMKNSQRHAPLQERGYKCCYRTYRRTFYQRCPAVDEGHHHRCKNRQRQYAGA